MKTERNEVIVSGIIPRNNKYNDKGMDVNKFLISFCLTCKFYFIDNSNINKETHLNMSGLHLNAKGQYALGTNRPFPKFENSQCIMVLVVTDVREHRGSI